MKSKYMNTSGQVNQVFVYIMGLLIIGSLIILGFGFIDKILGRQCDIQSTEFNGKVASGLDQARRYGAIKKIEVRTPCNARMLCFINTSSIEEGQDIGFSDNIINSAVHSGIQTNIYLIDGQGDVEPIGYDERITTGGEQAYYCALADSGRFAFTVEGLGRDGVLVR